MAEVAELLNREGVPHRGSWTRESVKDILRRGRMYLGFVIEKRGRDERPGQHEPILSEVEYRATLAAVAARRRVGNKPRPFRHYLLRGLLTCACGTRMRGEAHLQRGTERRYYRCPKLGCRAQRCPADSVRGGRRGQDCWRGAVGRGHRQRAQRATSAAADPGRRHFRPSACATADAPRAAQRRSSSQCLHFRLQSARHVSSGVNERRKRSAPVSVR